MDEHGYVMATIPATSTKAAAPVIGFIAHVDTSPEMSGAGVKPIVHRAFDGRDLVLPDDPAAVLRVADWPYLGECVGHDIVTASGTTLLGADNKSGVAEIMAAAEYLLAHPEIPHGPIRIGFTPDEEVGQGTKHFDVGRFGAACAYTMDGGERGELEYESFSADAIALTFQGFNTHPGFAKGRMVNAIKLAARFIDRLPGDRLSPETTDGRDGFVHPYVVTAGVDKTTVQVHRPRFRHRRPEGEGRLAGGARAGGDRRDTGRLARRADHRAVPQHARGDRPASARRAVRARRDGPPRHHAARASDPRRHRRVPPVVHGAADAERVRRRAELPLAARVGVGPGHGKGRRRDRRDRQGLGGASMTRLRIGIAIAAALALAAGAAACGGSSREAPATPGYRIAVVPKGATHEHWKRVRIGAEKAAAEFTAKGVPVEVLWKAPIREDDREQQVQVVEGFTSQKVSGLVLAPLDSHALMRPVEEAAQAGIPTVIFDSALADPAKGVSYVSTDNEKGGRLAARRMAEVLAGKGTVLMLRYQEGSAATEERERGFTEELEGAGAGHHAAALRSVRRRDPRYRQAHVGEPPQPLCGQGERDLHLERIGHGRHAARAPGHRQGRVGGVRGLRLLEQLHRAAQEGRDQGLHRPEPRQHGIPEREDHGRAPPGPARWRSRSTPAC